MQDLKEVTAAIHYENFRAEKLRFIASQSNFDASAGKYVPSHFLLDVVYCTVAGIYI